MSQLNLNYTSNNLELQLFPLVFGIIYQFMCIHLNKKSYSLIYLKIKSKKGSYLCSSIIYHITKFVILITSRSLSFFERYTYVRNKKYSEGGGVNQYSINFWQSMDIFNNI